MLALPFVYGTYQPAVKAAPGAELRQVEQRGWPAGTVKGLQAGAEIRPLVYEPLGWANERILVYRTWRGAGYDRTGAWQDGAPGPVLAYDVAGGASRPSEILLQQDLARVHGRHLGRIAHCRPPGDSP